MSDNRAREELIALLDRNGGPDGALFAIFDYLVATGIPEEKLHALAFVTAFITEVMMRARKRGRPGPKGRMVLSELSLSIAGAAVTKRKRHGELDNVVRKVSGATGIPGPEIKKFRNAVHRGTSSELATSMYQDTLKRLGDEADIDATLRAAKIFWSFAEIVKSTRR